MTTIGTSAESMAAAPELAFGVLVTLADHGAMGAAERRRSAPWHRPRRHHCGDQLERRIGDDAGGVAGGNREPDQPNLSAASKVAPRLTECRQPRIRFRDDSAARIIAMSVGTG